MAIDNFIRFAEVIRLKSDKRVVSVTVRPTVGDCTGSVYFTDLQLQDGDKLTGYTPHTTTMLRNIQATPRATRTAWCAAARQSCCSIPAARRRGLTYTSIQNRR